MICAKGINNNLNKVSKHVHLGKETYLIK